MCGDGRARRGRSLEVCRSRQRCPLAHRCRRAAHGAQDAHEHQRPARVEEPDDFQNGGWAHRAGRRERRRGAPSLAVPCRNRLQPARAPARRCGACWGSGACITVQRSPCAGMRHLCASSRPLASRPARPARSPSGPAPPGRESHICCSIAARAAGGLLGQGGQRACVPSTKNFGTR